MKKLLIMFLFSALVSSVTYCSQNNQEQNNQIPVQQIIQPQAGVVENNQQQAAPNNLVDPRISRVARIYGLEFFGEDLHPDDPAVTNNMHR
ncbi:hypothetical protein EBU24_05155 [bacterium]|nr:hypothetical protein [bacterium]